MHLFLDIDHAKLHHPTRLANAKFIVIATHYPCLLLYHKKTLFTAVESKIFERLQKC